MGIQAHFGCNVRNRREELGFSQDKLSEVSGLHRTYISGVERGIRNPTIEVVNQLALALETTPAELFIIKNNGLN